MIKMSCQSSSGLKKMIVPVKIKNLIFLFKKPSAARDGGYRTVHSYVLNTRLKHAHFNDRFEVGYICSVWKSARAQAQLQPWALKQSSLGPERPTWNISCLTSRQPVSWPRAYERGCAGLGIDITCFFSLYWFLHSSSNGFATKGWGGLEHTEYTSEIHTLPTTGSPGPRSGPCKPTANLGLPWAAYAVTFSKCFVKLSLFKIL